MNHDNLNASEIKKYLQTNPMIKVFNEIDSTNNYCKRYDLVNPSLVVANYQTHGRGQFERRFYSPAETGIYMTIVIPAQKRFIINPGSLTAGVGNAVVQAITNLGGHHFQLKWINDIYHNYRKCGGILVETNMNDDNQIQSFVVGIGLNLYHNDFPNELKQQVSFIFNHQLVTRNRMIAEIWNCFDQMYYQNSDKTILQTYEKNMLGMHQNVILNINGKKLNGIISGVSPSFRLILKDSVGKIHKLNSNLTHRIKLFDKS